MRHFLQEAVCNEIYFISQLDSIGHFLQEAGCNEIARDIACWKLSLMRLK